MAVFDAALSTLESTGYNRDLVLYVMDVTELVAPEAIIEHLREVGAH